MEDLRHENPTVYDTPAYKKRKRRFGDRSDGRRLRTIPPMHYVEPFIMNVRSDAQNHFEDVIDITNAEAYLAEKHKAGYTDLALLHIILAAYIRVVSERPGINRFIAGQQIYAHNTVPLSDRFSAFSRLFRLDAEKTAEGQPLPRISDHHLDGIARYSRDLSPSL